MLSNLNKKPYILKTTLEPNQIYSCFGIKIKVKEQVDTFSNKGNFSIHINNINLKALKSQSHNTITKDTPLFCYVQESNQTHIVKLQDSTTSINIQLNKNLPKDSNGNLIPIIPKLIFLSFIPFRDSKEANNSPSQKIALTADDIDKNYINVDFKIPLKYLGEWEGIRNQTTTNAQNGKKEQAIFLLEKHSRFTDNTQKTEAKTYFKIRNKSKKIKKLIFDKDKVQNLTQSKDINSIKNLLKNHQNDKIDFVYTLNNNEKDKAIILFAYNDKNGIDFEVGNFVLLGFEAIDVAKFIVDEMKNNRQSKEAMDIKKTLQIRDEAFNNAQNPSMLSYSYANVALANDIKASYMFYLLVDSGKVWDHKWQIAKLFPTMGLSTPFYHRYFYNNKYYEIGYDVWSNIHYGYIGKVIGFNEITLHFGADMAQSFSNRAITRDDPKDAEAIKLGFKIYDEYNEKFNDFTANKLLDIIMKNKDKLNVKEAKQ